MAARAKRLPFNHLLSSTLLVNYSPDQKEIDTQAPIIFPPSQRILLGKDEKETQVILQVGRELAKDQSVQGFVKDRLLDAYLRGDAGKLDQLIGAIKNLEENQPTAVEVEEEKEAEKEDEKDDDDELEPGFEDEPENPDVKEVSDFFNNNKNPAIRKLTPDVVKQPIDTLLEMHAWVRLSGDEFAGRAIQSFFSQIKDRRYSVNQRSDWVTICTWFRQNKEHRIQELAKKVEEQSLEIILGIEGWTEIVGQPFAGHAIESYLQRFKQGKYVSSSQPAGIFGIFWVKVSSWLPSRFVRSREAEVLQPGAPGLAQRQESEIEQEAKREDYDRDVLMKFIDKHWKKLFGVAALLLLGCALHKLNSPSAPPRSSSPPRSAT